MFNTLSLFLRNNIFSQFSKLKGNSYFSTNAFRASLIGTHSNFNIPTFLRLQTPLYYDKRSIVINKPRRQIGHKFVIGKHKRAKVNPPRVPIHPNKDVDKDMNLFETYRDLKLRWKRTTRSRKNRLRIARKWRQPYYFNPTNQPTCMFVLHENLPRTRTDKPPEMNHDKEYVPGKIELDESHNFQVYPPDSVVQDIKNLKTETFCIFKSSPLHQHKVTKGDVVQIERLKRKNAGDKVTFGTVLLVGSKYWTIIGKPTVPYAKVHATIEQQTLCGEQLSFRYRKSRRISKFLRVRHWVTVLRIDDIVVDPSIEINTEHKPSRLLDLWSNRWLYTEELEDIDKTKSESEQIYDGLEHETGYYNKLGLTESYRWYPDPYSKYKWK
ncbi:50S ribosomal protein L21, putative [Theileria annulata]|uniref:Large ribosomal subunit protein bL21m n=1 Tax=Theileria annulata TaxID=5874 RepID=Q4U8K1_THEAN|nr:50S ribosomal protein L21, putative [Theileria annulata]CAI76852.1 50S ribosomal protein L21, putative [Theileria annulata]|eukprot:XP_953477.1 50S ribosomal protein L21, putative [Theileria annulata]